MFESARARYDLAVLARRAMIERGLEPDFPADALAELGTINGAAQASGASIRDLRHLLWCSIDNDDSKDIDQITVAERLSDGKVKVFVGIADVDAVIKTGSPIDAHARRNTTSVYTGVRTFPMLPEKLSTNLTSLSEGEERLAVVVEMVVGKEGEIEDFGVYRAIVVNHAQLTYNGVSTGLEGHNGSGMPDKVYRIPEFEAQLRLQDQVAQRMRALRHRHGALELQTIEPRVVTKDGAVIDLVGEQTDRARELIEDFMIGVNGVTAKFLDGRRFPTIRRTVRSPKRWDRIVQVAEEVGEHLPSEPDARALAEFLSRRRRADPLRFPDLSLTIVKLLGAGEYTLQLPGEEPTGHFGLAVRNYAHSTAPNRRYPDLITQRLLKAALDGDKTPYDNEQLSWLAAHCTHQEDAANKVERQVHKSAAALLLSKRIGDGFDAIVTGASSKGTWARVIHPPVEGRVIRGIHNLDVGDRIRVRLVAVNVERGFIDFERV